MNEPFIVDAHAHIGLPGLFFSPDSGAGASAAAAWIGFPFGWRSWPAIRSRLPRARRRALPPSRRVYEESQGACGTWGFLIREPPRNRLRALNEAARMAGICRLEAASFLASHLCRRSRLRAGVARLRPSTICPSSPTVGAFPTTTRSSAIPRPSGLRRMSAGFPRFAWSWGMREAADRDARKPSAWPTSIRTSFWTSPATSSATRLIETLAASVPAEKILFGSDFPWIDPRANLSRVLLADVDDRQRKRFWRITHLRYIDWE